MEYLKYAIFSFTLRFFKRKLDSQLYTSFFYGLRVFLYENFVTLVNTCPSTDTFSDLLSLVIPRHIYTHFPTRWDGGEGIGDQDSIKPVTRETFGNTFDVRRPDSGLSRKNKDEKDLCRNWKRVVHNNTSEDYRRKLEWT